MEVNVLNSLSAELTTVVDHPEALAEVIDLSHLGDSTGYVTQDFVSISRRCNIEDILKMLLGNHQYVYRSYRVDVIKTVYILILIDRSRWDLLIDNIAKKAPGLISSL